MRLLLDLVRQPTWLIGFSGLVGSFVLQAVALGLGQLSAIEPIITLEVPLTLLVASRVFRAPLGRLEWTGILIMTAGMILLVPMLDPHPGDETDVAHADLRAWPAAAPPPRSSRSWSPRGAAARCGARRASAPLPERASG